MAATASIILPSCSLCGKESLSVSVHSKTGFLRGSPLKISQSVFVNKESVSKSLRICASERPEPEKESLFTSITNALDFTAVRSEEDRQLIEDARQATKMGGKMSREQYAALRRKVGGTAKSYFKEFIDVDGDYVESGWVDKSCKYCKKDTSGAPRQKDGGGRYAHVSCAEEAKSRGNFFTRLFSG